MATRILSTRGFAKFAKASHIGAGELVEAVARAEAGLIDADLGGGVIKQRIARQGAGRSGGYRTLIAFRSESRAVYVFGFSKNDRENVSRRELSALRLFAADLLSSDEKTIDAAINDGSLVEIKGRSDEEE